MTEWAVGHGRQRRLATLYHQTSPEAAWQIITTQEMKPGTGGFAGPGIYFAGYPTATGWKARQIGTILKCKVDLGRVQETRFSWDWSDRTRWFAWLWPNYDTIKVTCLNGNEFVVYEPRRVKKIIWHSGLPPREPRNPIIMQIMAWLCLLVLLFLFWKLVQFWRFINNIS